MALFLIASLMAFCVNSVHGMRQKATVKAHVSEDEQFWDRTTCDEIVEGGQARESASWLDSRKCQCPWNWILADCGEASGQRYFSKDLTAHECICRPPSGAAEYVDMDHQQPHILERCAVDYGYGDTNNLLHKDLPDFLESAHEWCRSDLVPEDKRVPATLRGLYWMKDLKLDDVAFCPSLGEWDAKTMTLRMSVWNMFVFGKKAEEKISHLAESASHLPIFGVPLIYSIKFTNSSMKEASIKTNLGLGNLLVDFPMWEIDGTPDGTVKSEKPGDVYYRWSALAGFETGTYYPVRIMDDDGTKHLDRYEHMKLKESLKNTTFQRFKTIC